MAGRRMSRVDQHVHESNAQPFGVGCDGRRDGIEIHVHHRARPGRLGCRRRLPAQRVQIGRCDVETDRPREIEHVVDDAVETFDFFVDVVHRLAHGALGDVLLPERVQRSLDDHQRIPHFVRDHRRQTSEREQPFAL